MAKLECDRCGVVYSDPADIQMAKRHSECWEEVCRANGEVARGLIPCPYITCPGEMTLYEEVVEEVVTVTRPDGTVASREETQRFLQRLREGIFYLPQGR